MNRGRNVGTVIIRRRTQFATFYLTDKKIKEQNDRRTIVYFLKRSILAATQPETKKFEMKKEKIGFSTTRGGKSVAIVRTTHKIRV